MLHIYIYVYIYVFVHNTYIHIYVHTYIHTYIDTYIHIHTHTHTRGKNVGVTECHISVGVKQCSNAQPVRRPTVLIADSWATDHKQLCKEQSIFCQIHKVNA